MPAYHGWQGEVVTTPPEVEEAILRAMGATTERPPRLRPPRGLTDQPCVAAPERAWGWAIQLYALRSRDSWGIGDFADLHRFGRWARGAGASHLLLNPLGAQTPTLPYQPSPYYASSRRFRNVVYLRVEDVEGSDQVDLRAAQNTARELNGGRIIDYDAVYQLKSAALEEIFRVAPQPRGLAAYVRRQGRALRDFATFNARCETRGPAWRDWPDGGDQPDPQRIAYHQWLQFHLDRQLGRAARGIKLITDVPVGFASDGFDAWRWRACLTTGTRVGAPPDEFFRDGQDWGLPPFNPCALASTRWGPFLDALRAATEHAAGIRLDHVMSLFRLFWIPEGMNAAHGAYVKYPAPILLSMLAGESRRANAFVIGEDLGLVEPNVRRHLARKGSLSYRLVWFEDSDPADWPHDAVGAVGTHDLPTIAGIWTRSEPEHRLHHLRDRLVKLTRLPDETDAVDVAVATYAELARGRPRIVLASMEDALGVRERPNVPGTTHEMPNWRLALPIPIEEIETSDGPRRIAEAMRAAGR